MVAQNTQIITECVVLGAHGWNIRQHKVPEWHICWSTRVFRGSLETVGVVVWSFFECILLGPGGPDQSLVMIPCSGLWVVGVLGFFSPCCRNVLCGGVGLTVR